MNIKYIMIILTFIYVVPLPAQERDSLQPEILDEAVVSDSYSNRVNRRSVLPVVVAGADFLSEHFTGSLMRTLEYLPGIHSMDVGSGLSKPMIRGMGFNRVVVTENGVKQEGQQWGADHGLEIDAFGVEQATVRKGPASLVYGSDAMGGVIEIMQSPAPSDDRLYGEVAMLGKSVNGLLGASVMTGVTMDGWHVKMRFSEQHFADYYVPTDMIVYLTQRLPVYNRRLKNTAGFERDAGLFSEYRRGRYYANYSVSEVYQKVGFFPGAHGVPDASRVADDGSSRNIDMPYSTVSHLKFSSRQRYTRRWTTVFFDVGFQSNRREERSLFHTHYGNQAAPDIDPNKELAFVLNTFSSSVKADATCSSKWKHTFGVDLQYQHNRVGGYSFLLPEYSRFTTGGLWLSSFCPSDRLSFSGGVRYDYGMIGIAASQDVYLERYLRERNYEEATVEAYKWRSRGVNRHFDDVSGSLGFVWIPDSRHQLKVNLGRSFRLPGANELASNGVHHGAFRHEQGDASLVSERGWQLDAAYSCTYRGVVFTASPFLSRFDRYVYLKPSGEWSILPHAGQIYRYTGVEAVFAGAEVELLVALPCNLSFHLTGEYVYTRNLDERTPLSFSPPASMRNRLTWTGKSFRFNVELQCMATQNRVAKNEDVTPGVNLLHVGATVSIPLSSGTTATVADITFSLQNVFNTKYYNHLSFYRKVEIPEPGRNFQLLIKLPFKNRLK
jgi:iron complex outermembrane receptor protein